MLSPTHEEEITSLVASTLNSYKELPLRLYQISTHTALPSTTLLLTCTKARKYRDEIRPRHGLLRSREFIMKDLYSFDTSAILATETYKQVSEAYAAFFAEIKLPILVAEASSGDMGGDHSHEYHLPNEIGEDTIAQCTSCGYTANDEVAASRLFTDIPQIDDPAKFQVWRGITKDRQKLVNVWYPKTASAHETPNLHAVKAVIPDLDTSIGSGLSAWELVQREEPTQLLNVVDYRLAPSFSTLQDKLSITPSDTEIGGGVNPVTITQSNEKPLDLLQLADGDGCPKCDNGQLKVHKALELGHTFYLGTRYSEPLQATVTLPPSPNPIPLQMGCYGIGLSRIFGAVAEHKADSKGLNWPRAIAPFEVVIISTSKIGDEVLQFHDKLTQSHEGSVKIDAVLDDRKETFGWKMQDADLIGYPVVVVLGKAWREHGQCEIQCRALGVKENVSAENAVSFIKEMLTKM